MACEKCGKTTEMYSHWEDEPTEHAVVDGTWCMECEQKERDKEDRRKDLDKLASSILSAPQGASPLEFTNKLMQSNHKPTPDEAKSLWEVASTHPDVYRRGITYFTRRYNEPELKVGTKIWRRVEFFRFSYNIPKNVFDKTGNSYVAYAAWGNSWGGAWEGYHKKPGMICFSAVEIPENWIALIVTGFSINGRSAFVKPYVGSTEELLDAHKKACSGCGTKRAINAPSPCATCREKELAKERAESEARRAKAAQEELGYVPSPKVVDKPFICRVCMPKAPKGSGKCAVYKMDYA